MDERVTLELSGFLYSYDEVNKILYFTGTALEEGAWYGAGSAAPLFCPTNIIHAAAHNFTGVELWEDHMPGAVGVVLDVFLTERGFGIFGAITDPSTIHRVLYEKKRGLSVGMSVYKDERNIVYAISECEEISVVDRPACTVCTINSEFYYGDEITMTAIDAFKELYETAEKFKAAQEKLSNSILDTIKTPGVETKAPCPKMVAKPVEEITMTENIVEETPVVEETPIVEEEAPVAPVVEEEGVKMAAHVAVQEQLSAAQTELSAVKEQLGAKDAELESVKTELAVTQEKLAAMIDGIKAKHIAEIKAADPDVDDAVLKTMSVEHLSAFAASVAGAVPKIGAKRQSKESVELSANVEQPPVFAGIIGYLQSKHR